MAETAVIYKSHYGSSRRYAMWIAEATSAKLYQLEDATVGGLEDCDTVVYIGGLYAGHIAGLGWLRRNYKSLAHKTVIVVSVGAAKPDARLRRAVLRENFTGMMLAGRVRLFALRGGIVYGNLKSRHRFMLKAYFARIGRKPPEKRTIREQATLDAYGKVADYTDKNAIEPILRYIAESKTGVPDSDSIA